VRVFRPAVAGRRASAQPGHRRRRSQHSGRSRYATPRWPSFAKGKSCAASWSVLARGHVSLHPLRHASGGIASQSPTTWGGLADDRQKRSVRHRRQFKSTHPPNTPRSQGRPGQRLHPHEAIRTRFKRPTGNDHLEDHSRVATRCRPAAASHRRTLPTHRLSFRLGARQPGACPAGDRSGPGRRRRDHTPSATAGVHRSTCVRLRRDTSCISNPPSRRAV
jgi:hypothetical protein